MQKIDSIKNDQTLIESKDELLDPITLNNFDVKNKIIIQLLDKYIWDGVIINYFNNILWDQFGRIKLRTFLKSMPKMDKLTQMQTHKLFLKRLMETDRQFDFPRREEQEYNSRRVEVRSVDERLKVRSADEIAPLALFSITNSNTIVKSNGKYSEGVRTFDAKTINDQLPVFDPDAKVLLEISMIHCAAFSDLDELTDLLILSGGNPFQEESKAKIVECLKGKSLALSI